jgi:hypothetical protein
MGVVYKPKTVPERNYETASLGPSQPGPFCLHNAQLTENVHELAPLSTIPMRPFPTLASRSRNPYNCR